MHVVSDAGLSTDPEKIRAVVEWPVPVGVTDLRSFLGLCSYYRKFTKGFAEIARPLYRLTEKGKDFVWTEECDEAFSQLKTALTTAPILAYPSTEDPFILDTDASNFGLGVVLSQVQEGEEKVIAYITAPPCQKQSATTASPEENSWR
ncbi:hypothetical protein QZH41_002178 [Actinostola sp. cb2023]|nr:hypothetical protein QZH41_002178 [Actinostola sp. cb2023]